MASRIAGRFAARAGEGRTVLAAYVVAGDPHPDVTVDLLHDLVAAGADILELGVPFSDPMSEGPVIQLGHERALANGVGLKDVLAMVRKFREGDAETPLLLMGYANPVEHMGYAVFADAASDAGVDGLLTVDIPPEEVAAVDRELRRVGLDNILLVAPTTPADRIRRIAAEAGGFIYYVSLKGVTGAGHLDAEDVARHVAGIREACSLPVAVGFGIKDAASACAVAECADGVVVGSALVNAAAAAVEEGGDHAAARGAAAALLADIRSGLDALAS
jgi:tryptophan synthase alpha chain